MYLQCEYSSSYWCKHAVCGYNIFCIIICAEFFWDIIDGWCPTIQLIYRLDIYMLYIEVLWFAPGYSRLMEGCVWCPWYQVILLGHPHIDIKASYQSSTKSPDSLQMSPIHFCIVLTASTYIKDNGTKSEFIGSKTCLQGTLHWEDTFSEHCPIFPIHVNEFWRRDTCHVGTLSQEYWGVPWSQVSL